MVATESGKSRSRIARTVSLSCPVARAGRRSTGLGTSAGGQWTVSPKIGGSGRGCGRVTNPGQPERSRNVASQPAPKRPHCGRDPCISWSHAAVQPQLLTAACSGRRRSDLHGELDDGGGEDRHQQEHQDQAGSAPHAFGSLRPRPTETPGSVKIAGAPLSVARVIGLPACTRSSTAAERRSRASAHMP